MTLRKCFEVMQGSAVKKPFVTGKNPIEKNLLQMWKVHPRTCDRVSVLSGCKRVLEVQVARNNHQFCFFREEGVVFLLS